MNNTALRGRWNHVQSKHRATLNNRVTKQNLQLKFSNHVLQINPRAKWSPAEDNITNKFTDNKETKSSKYINRKKNC